jgi:hypothetical protein
MTKGRKLVESPTRTANKSTTNPLTPLPTLDPRPNRRLDRGMKATFTFLILALFASPLLAKKYPGLKVKGNYKEIHLVIENIQENEARLTNEDVSRAVRLRLLANGIKVRSRAELADHFLHINIGILSSGAAFDIDVCLKKVSKRYQVDEKVAGWCFTPEQDIYATFGTSGRSKQYILEALNAIILAQHVQSG